ncbi:MAG: hypothetical protein ABFD92_00460 [Planctomycetaceae bacterium]|nr:hypothetical protein [Planctomycetaceae bacterium]
MNKRDEISNELSAYLDGELSPSRVRQIDEVLAYDKDLAGELERLKATRNLLRQLPRERTADDFVRHVLARTERTHLLPAPAARAYRSMRWISYAAAAVVLLAVGAAGVMMVNAVKYATPQGPHKLGELARAPEQAPEKPGAPAATPDTEHAQTPDGKARRETELAGKDGTVEALKAPQAAPALPAQGGQVKNDLNRDVAHARASGEDSSGLRKKSVSDGYAAAESARPAPKSVEKASKDMQPIAKAPAPADTAAGAAPAGPARAQAKGGPRETPPRRAGEKAQEQQVAVLEKKSQPRSGENWQDEPSVAPPQTVAQRHGDDERTAPAPGAPAEQGDALTASNVVINTSSLAVAQRDIENAMVRNGVRPLVVKEQRSLGAATIGNYYLTNVNNDSQVQYEAFVTADQLGRLRGELSVIRAQQDVAQVPVEAAPAAARAAQASQLRQDFNDRNSYDYWNNDAARAAANRLNSLNNSAQTQAAQAKAPAGEPIADAPPMPLTQVAEAQPQEDLKKKEPSATQPAPRDAVTKQLDKIAAQEARVLNPLNQAVFNNEKSEQTNLFRLVVTLNGKMPAGQAQFEDARAARRQAPATGAAQAEMYKSLNPEMPKTPPQTNK